MEWLTWIILIIGGYLLGSVPSAYILVKLKRGIDIRRYGSGNVGSTNTVRVAGRATGIMVFCMDVAKGAIPTILGMAVCREAALAAGMAAFLGHLFPIWLGFKGGKGVATGFSVGLVICPVASLIAIAFWLVVSVITGYVSIGSCSAAVLLFILISFMTKSWTCALTFAIFAGIICLKHKNNFRNIKNGTEGKSFRRKNN